MERNRKFNEPIEDKLKLKYLNLMCKLKPDNVVQALKSYIFPLEDALKVCEQHKSLHGQAYIKSRTRNIDSAIQIYMQIMKVSFEKYLETDESDTAKSDKVLTDGLFAYQSIANICKQEFDEMKDEGVKYFANFTNFIFDMYSDLLLKEESATQFSAKLERIENLRGFIKTEIFDDFLITSIMLVGTDGLIEVSVVEL